MELRQKHEHCCKLYVHVNVATKDGAGIINTIECHVHVHMCICCSPVAIQTKGADMGINPLYSRMWVLPRQNARTCMHDCITCHLPLHKMQRQSCLNCKTLTQNSVSLAHAVHSFQWTVFVRAMVHTGSRLGSTLFQQPHKATLEYLVRAACWATNRLRDVSRTTSEHYGVHVYVYILYILHMTYLKGLSPSWFV